MAQPILGEQRTPRCQPPGRTPNVTPRVQKTQGVVEGEIRKHNGPSAIRNASPEGGQPLNPIKGSRKEVLGRCPTAMQEALAMKIDHYVKAGWWFPASSEQACLLLCIWKMDGSLRTVIDMRNHNSNTILNVTPMPEMRQSKNQSQGQGID